MSTPASGAPPGPEARWSVQAQARSTAPVDEVWPLIGEARRWKEWTFLTQSDLVRAGDPPPDGIGAVRRFTRFGIGSQEEVVAWEPPHHLGYTILKGFPVRHYRADVRPRTGRLGHHHLLVGDVRHQDPVHRPSHGGRGDEDDRRVRLRGGRTRRAAPRPGPVNKVRRSRSPIVDAPWPGLRRSLTGPH